MATTEFKTRELEGQLQRLTDQQWRHELEVRKADFLGDKNQKKSNEERLERVNKEIEFYEKELKAVK